jgi:peroxiredoxin
METTMLKPGQPAPVIDLPTADMTRFNSAELIGHSALVMYFYPKDDTPGCTLEALEFSDLLEQFEAAGCQVVGISKDTCVSHADFRDKHGIGVQLLADVEGRACEAFGCWQEREKNGKHGWGLVRSTFVIDIQGTLRHALYDIRPKDHAEHVLELVRAL